MNRYLSHHKSPQNRSPRDTAIPGENMEMELSIESMGVRKKSSTVKFTNDRSAQDDHPLTLRSRGGSPEALPMIPPPPVLRILTPIKTTKIAAGFDNSYTESSHRVMEVTKGHIEPDDGEDDDGVGTDANSLSQETDATSASSAQRQAREAGVSIFKLCGIKIRIPFTFWSFCAMCVPIIFLVITAARPVASAATELATIARLSPVASTGGDCVTTLVNEHSRTARYIRRGDNTSLTRMMTTRSDSIIACDMSMLDELRVLSTDDDFHLESYQAVLRMTQNLAVMRNRIDETRKSLSFIAGSADATAFVNSVRTVFEDSAYAVSTAIAACADQIGTKDTRYFLDIKLTADCRTAMWSAGATGYTLAGLQPKDVSDAEMSTYIGALQSAKAAFKSAQGLASPSLSLELGNWSAQNRTITMWQTFDKVRFNTASVTDTTFFTTVRTALNDLALVETHQRVRLNDAVSARTAVTDNVALLVCGVVACLVAGGLLAFQQQRVKKQLEAQVERVERTRKAVSAFVPRFFLTKMGYTSITQVRVGESTNVALAMLFADVRRFTTVSEGMTCTALFEWVQAYFKRMTTIVESRNGNVNEFIGDALFAVFTSCRDAVHCSIDMQSDVQQLNVQRLCEERNDIPIDIGVGLHHDVLAMGILGDERRHTCTAISSSVNLASRLEGLTKQLGCRILASAAVIDQLSPSDLDTISHRRIGPAICKGSASQVVVYDIFQTDEREIQQYKAHSRNKFEEFALLALQPDHNVAKTDALYKLLREAAEAANVEDPTPEQMLKHRDATTGQMIFDAK
jgi:class 3 adenylate cyclase